MLQFYSRVNKSFFIYTGERQKLIMRLLCIVLLRCLQYLEKLNMAFSYSQCTQTSIALQASQVWGRRGKSSSMSCAVLSIKMHSAKALHPKRSRALGLRSLWSEQMAIHRNVLGVSGCRLRNWILLSLSLWDTVRATDKRGDYCFLRAKIMVLCFACNS